MNKKIYVAGKYDDVNVINVLNNIKAGVKLATEILKQGDIPFCPFLDCLMVLIGDSEGLTQDHFRDYSMRWLECCDEIWLLPSWINSGGCKAELQRAREMHMTVKFVER
jgi:hypothetical protein